VVSTGEVFAADSGTSRVVELPAGGSQVTLPFTGLIQPEGVAVDSSGDVFATDGFNARVLELPAGGSQVTVKFNGLGSAFGVGVDSSGDVFVTENTGPRVLEVPAGGSQVTLPFSGLTSPLGVAVDSVGDVFVVDQNLGVIELTPSIPSGSLVVSPGSGPAGSSVAVSSVTPCPLGSAFRSTAAKFALYSPSGAVEASTKVEFDGAGDWAGTLAVPSSAANGAYFVAARCFDANNVVTQYYRSTAFTVGPASGGGSQGPPGPAGPAGTPGPSGTNGTNGTNGLNGASGPQGPQGATGSQGLNGPQGLTGPPGPSPSGSVMTCTNKRNTVTCTTTYSYNAAGAAADRVIATARIQGRTGIVGHGRIHRGKLTLVFSHVKPGRYRVTLLALSSHRHRTLLGYATVTIHKR
ncbi:MAG: NHL repeat-containing protein, partial [Solirubrobacteraceae bacterium]